MEANQGRILLTSNSNFFLYLGTSIVRSDFGDLSIIL